MKNSFSYSGAVLWNSLPIELRQANSHEAFRAGCQQFFLLDRKKIIAVINTTYAVVKIKPFVFFFQALFSQLHKLCL